MYLKISTNGIKGNDISEASTIASSTGCAVKNGSFFPLSLHFKNLTFNLKTS